MQILPVLLRKSLLLLLLPGLVFAEPTISWQNPTLNVDGTPLTDLTTIRLHWGLATRSYTDNVLAAPSESAGYDLNLAPGTYYIAATAINSTGNESAYSNEIIRTVEAPPAPEAPVLTLATCTGCASENVLLLVGQTGNSVNIQWQPTAHPVTIEVYEYPVRMGAIPLVRGEFISSNNWLWTPTRSGLYYSRMRSCDGTSCSPWTTSFEQGFLYYFRVAAPTGGGIDG